MTQAVLTIPPQTITVGLPFPFTLRMEDPTADDPAIPLTGFTVEWALSERPFETAFATGTGEILTADDGDHVFFEITDTSAYGAYALPIIGGRPSAILQITLTAPVAANSIVLQGQAIIQGVL